MPHNRETILFEILQDQKDRHLTATSVRNEILRRDKSIMLDKVVQRRWVNGKFVTLVRRGILAKHRNERGKAYFLVLKDGVDMELKTGSRQGQIPPARPRASDPPPLPYGQLRKELGEYRLKAISQMGEIEEYKRISEIYPDLRMLVTEKFESAVDENSRSWVGSELLSNCSLAERPCSATAFLAKPVHQPGTAGLSRRPTAFPLGGHSRGG